MWHMLLFLNLHSSSLELLQYIQVCLVLEKYWKFCISYSWAACNPSVFPPNLSKSLSPAENTLLSAAQEALSHKGTFPAYSQTGDHQHLQVLFCKAALQTPSPQPLLVHEAAPHGLYRASWNSWSAHFSSLSRYLWMAAHPSGATTLSFISEI